MATVDHDLVEVSLPHHTCTLPMCRKDANGVGKGKKNSGVSLGALIGGVVGTAAGTSLLLGFLFLVALKKDWIVTKKESRRRSDERGMMGEAGQPLHKYSGHDPNLQQIGGDPVYQLPS